MVLLGRRGRKHYLNILKVLQSNDAVGPGSSMSPVEVLEEIDRFVSAYNSQTHMQVVGKLQVLASTPYVDSVDVKVVKPCRAFSHGDYPTHKYYLSAKFRKGE